MPARDLATVKRRIYGSLLPAKGDRKPPARAGSCMKSLGPKGVW